MNENALIYRRLNSHEQYLACERLQKETWGFDDVSVVPGHILITFQKRGGLVLGAFDGDRLIGFVYGFVGWHEGKPTHNSVMSAVRPEYRNRGVAYQLKLEQRRLAMQQGFELMTWTFDPLQALNAHFNLNKLGVIVRGYWRDLYGPFRDQINKNLPTDRFAVEWWLDTPRTLRRLEASSDKTIPPLPDNPPRWGDAGLLNPSDRPPAIEDKDRLHLVIPLSVDQLKAQDAQLAMAWRLHMRAWLETALQAGFIVHDFCADHQRKLGIYTLSRKALQTVLWEEL